MQGAVANLTSITAILSPIFMTRLFSYYFASTAPALFPGAPYLVAGVFVLGCVLIAMRSMPGGESGEKTKVVGG